MKIFFYLIGYLIYPFSFLFPRNEKIWVFGSSRGAFNDNAKYLFIYTAGNRKKIRPIWLSVDKKTVAFIRKSGLESYYIGSLKGLFYSLIAKYWFFNSYTSDILFFTSGGSICINLWHGIGLKKIEFSIENGPLADTYIKKTLKKRFFYPQVFRRPDYFLSTTDFQSVKFARAFRIDLSRCLNLGYPRNEIMVWNNSKRADFILKYEPSETREILLRIQKFRKTFIYMPTWRESQKNIFIQNFDLRELNQLMVQKNSLFILKPHSNTTISGDINATYSNLFLMKNTVDIYPLLSYTDVLITDYSSVLYDYLLLENKEIILYLYDFEKYVNVRDFNYPFIENVVGKIVTTFGQLTESIKAENYQTDRIQKQELKNKFWGITPDDVCGSILKRVLEK